MAILTNGCEKCCEVSYLIGGIGVLYFGILTIIKLHVASRRGVTHFTKVFLSTLTLL